MTLAIEEYWKIVNYFNTKVCPLQREAKLKSFKDACSSFYFACNCKDESISGCGCETSANSMGGSGDNRVDVDLAKLSTEERSILKTVLTT